MLRNVSYLTLDSENHLKPTLNFVVKPLRKRKKIDSKKKKYIEEYVGNLDLRRNESR